jgi:hypothetical protein
MNKRRSTGIGYKSHCTLYFRDGIDRKMTDPGRKRNASLAPTENDVPPKEETSTGKPSCKPTRNCNSIDVTRTVQPAHTTEQ